MVRPITEINAILCFAQDPCGEIRGEPQSTDRRYTWKSDLREHERQQQRQCEGQEINMQRKVKKMKSKANDYVPHDQPLNYLLL